jgi:hypothetical protein
MGMRDESPQIRAHPFPAELAYMIGQGFDGLHLRSWWPMQQPRQRCGFRVPMPHTS